MSKSEMYNSLHNYIINNLSSPIRVVILCSIFNLTKEELDNLFLENSGKNLVEFIAHAKGALAKYLLAKSEYSVIAVAEKVGMSYYQFQKFFEQLYGQTPGSYKSQMMKLKKQNEAKPEFVSKRITLNTHLNWIKIVVDYVIDYIEGHYPDVTPKEIGTAFDISEEEINFCFMTLLNISLSKYITLFRINKIRKQLESTNDSEETIASDNGVAMYYFETFFSRNMKCSPCDYRELMDDSGRAIGIKMTPRR